MIIPLAEPLIDKQNANIIYEQVKSSFVGPGKKADEFASILSKVTNRKFAIPTTSGTVALSIAAKAMGLKRGDEILIPSYGVISVINSFTMIGLNPKLVDIKKENGCMDPDKIEKQISKKTKGVCFISFLGSIGSEIYEIKKICKKYNLILIEDAAWSLGRSFKNKKGGSIGDIAITSFSVPKIITTGQGGAIFTDSSKIKNKVIELIDQGGLNWRKTNNISSIGSNLRMSDINAALGISQLKNLNKRMLMKKKINNLFNSELPSFLIQTSDGIFPSQNVFFSKNKDRVIKKLREKGVMATSQYKVYSKLKAYKKIFKNKSFAIGDYWTKNAVYLPFGIGTKFDQFEFIIKEIKKLDI